MDGEVGYCKAKERISLQLGQSVVPKSEIKYFGVLPLEFAHSLGDVLQLGALAHNVQTGFLHTTGTG